MRKAIPAAAILLAAARAASAQMVYEPFEYGTAAQGTNLANTNGAANAGYFNPLSGTEWANAGTTAPGVTGEMTLPAGGGGLSLAGLAASAGDSVVSNAGANNTVIDKTARIGFLGNGDTSTSGTTYYYSFLLKITDMSNLTTNDTLLAGFNNSVGAQTNVPTVIGTRLYIKKGADSTHYLLGGAPGNTTVTYSPTSFAAGTDTVLVVGSYQRVSGANLDKQSMWIQPASSSFGLAAPTLAANGLVLNNATGTSMATDILSFMFGLGTAAALPSSTAPQPLGMQVDEIRIDTNYAQVTPPTGLAGSAGNWSGFGTSAGSFINFGSGGGVVNVDAPATVGTINIKDSTGYTFSGSALTMDGSTGGVSAINVLAPVNAASSPSGNNAVVFPGNHTVSTNLNLNNGLEANVGLNQTLTLSGIIAPGTSATAGVTKSGIGTLVLIGPNTYTGNTTLNRGVLEVNSDASFGAVPGSIVANNISIGGATSGVTAQPSSTLRFDSSFTLNANRGVALAPAITNLNQVSVNIDTQSNSVTIAGPITSSATYNVATNVTKIGSGTLTLTNSGNTIGGININAGTLDATSDGALGSISVGNNLGQEQIHISNGATFQYGSAFSMTANRGISLGTGGGIIDTQAFNVTMGGIMTGGGSLTKAGSGTLTLLPSLTGAGGLPLLNHANSYSGGTIVNGGVLQMGSSTSSTQSPLNTGGAMTVNAAGTLDLNSFNIQVGSLAGSGAVTLGSATLTVGGTTSTTYSGGMSGAGGLTKQNTGTLTLSGASSYTGPTTIKGGTIVAGASNNLGDATNINNGVTLDTGGTLKTSPQGFSMSRAVTVNAGGGTIDTNGFDSSFTGALTGAGTLTKNSLGTLHVTNVRTAGLTINAGTVHVLPSGDAAASASSLTSAPTIAAGAKLDIDDNSVVINYSGGSPLQQVHDMIALGRGPAGFGNATWNGLGGITSSKASKPSEGLGGIGSGVDPAIGYGENSGMPIASFTAFNGQTVNSSSILIKYTRGADATLDGKVDNSDVTVVGTEFNNPNSGQWYLGDFDYSGTCDNSDVTALGTLFNPTAPPLSPAQLNAEFGSAFAQAFAAGQASAAVPEPTSMVLLGLGGLGLLGKRRRRA